MLFRSHDLDAIRAGTVDLAFRRWRRPSVKAGTRLRTAIGVVEVIDVVRVDIDSITDDDARRAGAPRRDVLLARLAAAPAGDVYRIELRYAGGDPRAALRRTIPSGDAEMAAVLARLDRLDKASRRGPWTRAALSLIAAGEGVRAAELAARLGLETLSFKADVRKLKELGLTRVLMSATACRRVVRPSLPPAGGDSLVGYARSRQCIYDLPILARRRGVYR